MPQFRDNFHSEEAQEIMGRALRGSCGGELRSFFVILALIVFGAATSSSIHRPLRLPYPLRQSMPPPTSRPVTTDCSTAYVSATGRTSVPVSLSLCSRHRPTTTTSGRGRKSLRHRFAASTRRGRLGVRPICSGRPASHVGGVRARCLDFRHYLATDLIGTKKRLLAAQIAKNKCYYAQLEAQGKLLDKDLAMGQRTLERDSLLFSQSVISAADYETSVQNYLAKQNSKAGFDATLTSTELSILQTEQQLVELAVQRENEVAEYERTIGQLRQQLLAAIAQWKEQYAVIAPMDGIVSLQGYWSKGQHVTVGSALASIVPEKETEVIGRMEVPSAGFGKVETGQTVNVKLNGFPYMEYGVLKGTIRSISSVPASVQTATGTTIAYTVEVVFPEGMRTTYEKELPMIQQMDGTGEIITEDMRLIEQFIQPVVSLFKNR